MFTEEKHHFLKLKLPNHNYLVN